MYTKNKTKNINKTVNPKTKKQFRRYKIIKEEKGRTQTGDLYLDLILERLDEIERNIEQKLENKIKDYKIKDLLIDALLTDGGHHKQWYIERSLEKLGINIEDLRKQLQDEDYDFEEGIAP